MFSKKILICNNYPFNFNNKYKTYKPSDTPALRRRTAGLQEITEVKILQKLAEKQRKYQVKAILNTS